jgi:hypothetical protein
MIKKLVLTALALLIPTLACAGLVNIFVTSGSGSGSASKGGYFATAKYVNFSSNTASGYTLNKVTNNGAPVVTSVVNATHSQYLVPLSGATQTLRVSFTQPPVSIPGVLNAVTPSAVNVTIGTGQPFTGVGSTVKYAVTPTFTFTGPAGITFTPASGDASNPGNISTTINATTAGTYTGTLTLSAANAATVSTNFTINVAIAGSAGNLCLTCHQGWTEAVSYAASIHANSTHSTCTACHNGSGNDTHPFDVSSATVDPAGFVVISQTPLLGTGETPTVPLLPGVIFCTACHTGNYPIPHPTSSTSGFQGCNTCHTPTAMGDAHNIQPVLSGANPATPSPTCVGCHAQALNAGGSHVQDNAGVRAITGTGGEFGESTRNNAMGYRSHHIYNGAGVAPQDAQCIACHLEGTVGANSAVVIDPKNHAVDSKVHLRSGNTAISANFMWDPANPNHAGMDNFCMSCHNAAGAVSAYKNMSSALLHGMTPVTGASAPSALNPFGDLLSNAYDQMRRPAVVAVYEQFNTANPSHHAVRGQKYSGRTRNAADPNGRVVANQAVFKQYSGVGSADIHLNGKGVLSAYQVFGTYSTSGPASGFGPLFPGSRQTIYDSNLFVANYSTMNGTTLGDDSTLHCADCHSVGQWKSGSANAITWNNLSTASGGFTIAPTTVVVGAHGSQNEYMLRTSNGSDSLQLQSKTGAQNTNPAATPGRTYTNGTYVCFLCHKQDIYGDNGNINNLTKGTGALRGDGGHGGSIGPCNGNSYSGYGKTGTARYGVLVAGKASPAIGNLFAMSCAHCHNSGQQNFGGIHGATSTYMSYSTNGLDVAGSTLAANDASKAAYLVNVTHKPSYRFMGGESIRYNGGATANKWEAQTISKPHREGCYNLSQTTDATHMWNTTAPMTTPAGPTVAIVNNNNNDNAWGSTDYNNDGPGNRIASNNATSGWGSCNHHQGSTTTGPTSPTRAIQRPLVY